MPCQTLTLRLVGLILAWHSLVHIVPTRLSWGRDAEMRHSLTSCEDRAATNPAQAKARNMPKCTMRARPSLRVGAKASHGHCSHLPLCKLQDDNREHREKFKRLTRDGSLKTELNKQTAAK